MSGRSSVPDRDEARRAILDYLQRPDYRPVTQRDLLHRMHVSREARPLIRRLLEDLLEQGRIVRTRGNRLAAAGRRGTVRGRLDLHRDGFGFVIPEKGGAHVFVPRRGLGDARHRDTVAVRVTGPGRGGKLEGTVVSVLARADRTVLGVFRTRGRGGLVEPFDPSYGVAVPVPAPFRMGARGGDAVRLEILEPRGRGEVPEGKVLEVLGPLEAKGVDVRVVATKYGLAMEFPRRVLDEARDLPGRIPRDEAARRRRFGDPPPVTIDGSTAQDFDDAVAVQELPRGGFRLFVHIADVSHFVAPGDRLDREGVSRGTSVYFPGTVLPMFPERLSNDLCSLRPGRERLVQSVIIDFAADGEARRVRFADGIIRSAARLTYGQVEEVLDGKKRGHGVPRRVVPMLRIADRLRELLERRRHDRGSLDFDLPEPQILLDVEGMMTGVTIEPRNRAHLLIEEFMLAANEAVAAYLQARGAPCLFRIHEPPDPVKVATLVEFARSLGLRLRGDPERITSADIQDLVDQTEGRPEYPLVAQVALRTMKQARYSTEPGGHFGLAAPVYCHFTSPIRRYPDLVVHRLLRAVRRRRKSVLRDLSEGLDGLAEACSTLEREAEAAERELLAWKAVFFMKGREGEVFDGIVSGVAAFGLFVRLTETQVEGLLRVEELGRERFDYRPGRQELRGTVSGRSYRLGDTLKVRVARVDTTLRRVDVTRVARRRGARES